MKLFKKLASIYSGSGQEDCITAYIKRWIGSSISGAIVKQDSVGNLYVTKGISETYPCVVAHLDQVQSAYPSDYKVVETNDIIFGYSPSLRKHCGLGADDKCGIWIALKMLKKHDVIKVAFFPGEEIGCVGSSKADMDFFNDVRFVVEPDRRGAHDLITTTSVTQICSDAFVDAIQPKNFGYKKTDGLMTDVETLKHNGLKVSCINLSCGYYSPHTENEYVVKKDMVNALNFVDSIIENCTEVYAHEAEIQPFYGDYDCYRGYNKYYLDDYYYSRKSTGTTSTDDVEFEEYYAQYQTAEEYIEAEMIDNPHLTAKMFLATYGDSLDMLDEQDINEIIDAYRETLTEDDSHEGELYSGGCWWRSVNDGGQIHYERVDESDTKKFKA